MKIAAFWATSVMEFVPGCQRLNKNKIQIIIWTNDYLIEFIDA